MTTMQEKKASSGLFRSINVIARCRTYHLPIWQCPHFLFIAMGALTVSAILVFYFALAASLDPYLVASIAIGLAFFLLVQTFLVVRSFERIAEENRRQVEFLNIASHQLRDPVTAARWAIDILGQSAEEFSVETQRSLIIIRESVHRLAQLITSLLGVARIEAGTSQKRAESFAINLVVAEVTDAAKRYAHAANLTIDVHLPRHMLSVYADREQIFYVLDHLLDNALRYSPDPSTISVHLTQDGENVKVAVVDQGAGIPSDEQRRVFDKFFRASNAPVLAPGGAGLSLFVVKAVVESFGGKIDFSSTPGKGSTFWFSLPLRESQKS